MLFTQEPPSADLFSTPNSRRSVSGMKCLLPLKLLSPTAPEMEMWPSSVPTPRSNLAMRMSIRLEDRCSSMKEASPIPQIAAIHALRQRRDTPIYTQPGTPLPNPIYFPKDDTCKQCSPQGSICDESCIINDYGKEKKPSHQRDLADLQETMEAICEGDDTLLPTHIDTTTRHSALSFQCSGEDMFEDESAWLRSPLSLNNWPRPSTATPRDEDPDQRVASWLSDTSSFSDEADDKLGCATVLAPAKANVVEVNLSPYSGLAINIPPRKSSLCPPYFPFAPSNNRDSWLSTDTPPITPDDVENPDASPTEAYFSKKYAPGLPRRRLDLTMPSPPTSPRDTSHVTPKLAPSPPMSALPRIQESPKLEEPSRPLLSTPEHLLTTEDILSSLQEWTSDFPSAMLLPESGCISAIRSHLSQSPTRSSQRLKTSKPLPSAFPLDSSSPPRMKSLLRRKTTDISAARKASSATRTLLMPQRPSLAPIPSLPEEQTTNDETPSPDLLPIKNIFPNSNKTMQAALYAHVLAYIFVTSSLSSSLSNLPSTGSTAPTKGRQLMPYQSSGSPAPRKASVFHIIDRDSSAGATDSLQNSPFGATFDTAIKAKALQEDLRKCIFCLISVMDENFDMENMMGSASADIEHGSGMVFLRCLIEVVKSAELRLASNLAPATSGFF